MIKNLKKAFTIIELVIVIAVIAILAAVMIPTYSSLVEKANQSADIQAVKQMNTVLSTYVDGSIKNIGDAIEALDKDGIDFQNYTPLQKNHYFYFYMDGNTPKVVYTDKNDSPIYPDVTIKSNTQLMSLSGKIKTDSSWSNSDNISEDSEGNKTVKISSGAQFADFLNKYVEKSSDAQSITTIKLTGNIDMKGSNASFGTVTKNITLTSDGDTSYTISGMQLDQHSVLGEWDGNDKDYGQALFNKVESGITVTVSNVNFNNVVVRNDSGIQYGHSAVIFGTVEGIVIANKVEISNCNVYGCDKAGAVIGYLAKDASASLSDVFIKDTNIYGAAKVSKVIGLVTRGMSSKSCAKISIDNVVAKDDVKTFINENTWTLLWLQTDINFVTQKTIDINDVKTYFDNSDNTYVPVESKKYLNGMTTNDYYWFGGWSDHSFVINGVEYNDGISEYAYASDSGSESFKGTDDDWAKFTYTSHN